MSNRIENINIRDYQQACIETIITKINNGARRITVLMTTGLGKNITSLFLINKLNQIGISKILYVFAMRAAREDMHHKIIEYGLDNVGVASLHELGKIDINQYNCILFFDLQVLNRKEAEKNLCNYTGIVMSFGAPFQEIETGNGSRNAIEMENRIAAYGLSPKVMVYASLKVLDIRDVIEADLNEKEFIEKEIASQKNLLVHKLSIVVEKTEQIEKAYKEEEINKMKAEIEQYKLLVQFQAQLLSNVGISPDTVRVSFEKIQLYREQLKDEILSDNAEIKEAAIAKLQDLVANNVVNLTKSVAGGNTQRYEDILKDELTKKVWYMLTDKSKTFLITAKINYATMSKMNNGDELDYSGVCLLITKALEVEVTRRFYTEYKLYLEDKYEDHGSWPFTMLKRNTDIPIEESEFTLGSVVPVMGIVREYENNIISGYHRGNRRVYNEFIDFAKARLLDDISLSIIERKLEEDYHFIEKVRIDYRNPSAHRDELTIVSAAECFEYVIDTQKKLKKMLIDMKF